MNDGTNTSKEVRAPETATPVLNKSPEQTTGRNRIVALVIFMFIIASGAVWWLLWGQDHIFPADMQQPHNTRRGIGSKQVGDIKQTDPQWALFAQPKTGEVWLQERKKLPAQGWLKDEVSAEYYEVGSRQDNTVYLVFAPSWGIAGWWLMLEKTPQGVVKYIAQPQTTANYSDDRPYEFKQTVLTNKVSDIDYMIHYDSLSVPGYIEIGSDERVTKPAGLSLHSFVSTAAVEGTVKTKVLETKTSTLYRVEKKYVDTGLTAISYEMTLPIGTTVVMDYAPNKLNLEGYSWNNAAISTKLDESGKMVYDDLKSIASGCGGLSVAVTRSDVLKKGDLVAIGKTSTGRTTYEPKDKSHMLITKAYDEYAQFSKINNQAAVTKDVFLREHGVVIAENAIGELLVYARTQYAPQYGCAKPVVYLYPEKTTAINVRVGADVVVSEPLYPPGGWTVQARPDGQVTYQGRQYTSLFWEGPGVGEYPAITSGTVVARDKAEAAIRMQLKQQGLNAQEATDFMDFWKTRIPNKPFIRLTWLNTTQMDRLAPLYITPQPQTVQRIFLDMAGYDTRPAIAPQKLHGFTRTGFTVVEWGGLAYIP